MFLMTLIPLFDAALPVADAASSTAAAGESWQGPTAVYGGLTIAVALALWAVRQAFYVWTLRQEFTAFRDAVIGNEKNGTRGLIPELAARLAAAELLAKVQGELITAQAALLRERPWCLERRREVDARLADMPTRGSINDAFAQLRTLEKSAAEDRQKFAVAMERVEGVLERLEEKIDALGKRDD